MFETLHCISLRTIKYNDRNTILSAWTTEHGRMTFVMPEGAGREAVRRRAITMPLGVFEGECDLRPGREIHSLRDMRADTAISSTGLHASPAKAMLSIFLADVLDAVLRPSAPDSMLTEYLRYAIATLAAERRPAALANYHIVFLFKLMYFAGIYPDMDSWSPGAVFDMRDGRFRPTLPLHGAVLTGEEAEALRTLDRIDFSNAALLKLNRTERLRAIDRILEYYSIHIAPGLDSLQSLEVLRSLF